MGKERETEENTHGGQIEVGGSPGSWDIWINSAGPESVTMLRVAAKQ